MTLLLMAISMMANWYSQLRMRMQSQCKWEWELRDHHHERARRGWDGT